MPWTCDDWLFGVLHTAHIAIFSVQISDRKFVLCLYVTRLGICWSVPTYKIQGAHLTGKPGKVGEFDIVSGKSHGELGKVGEIVVCLWCATEVAIVTKINNSSTVK